MEHIFAILVTLSAMVFISISILLYAIYYVKKLMKYEPDSRGMDLSDSQINVVAHYFTTDTMADDQENIMRRINLEKYNEALKNENYEEAEQILKLLNGNINLN